MTMDSFFKLKNESFFLLSSFKRWYDNV